MLARRKKTKDESDDEMMKDEDPEVKKDEPDSGDDDDDQDGFTHPSFNTEDSDIRDMKYRLEKLDCSMVRLV